MSLVLYLFVALMALSLMVFFHELGHFIAARLFGVTVERFSIGFGKVLKRRHCCGTEWAFSALPLGGYVKMKGQDDADPLARDHAPDSYGGKKPWQRIVILLAGPAANILLAFFLYLWIAFQGAPLITAADYLPPVIGQVAPDTPAARVGLKPGDRIVAVEGRPVRYWYQISDLIRENPDPILLTIRRDGKTLQRKLRTKVVEGENEFRQKIHRRIIGISPRVKKGEILHFAPAQAFHYAWRETLKASSLIARSVKKMTTGEVSAKNVGGVITIFDIMMKFAQEGFPYLLFIMALISVNLGILNLLPIPALDGGHIMFNLYEIVTHRELSETALYRLTLFGWAVLGGLMFLGLYNDINRIWGGGING